MDVSLFISVLIILQLTYWVVGLRASKNVKKQEDYVLANKSVRLFPLMMTFFATQVGGGVILGSAEEAYLFGWPVLLYPCGAALGLIVLGCGVGRRLAEFSISTVAEIFEVVYRSPFLRKVASLLSVLSLFMILVAQVLASRKFLCSVGCDSLMLFLIFWITVIAYTTQGGLRAVISTDIVQALVFSVVFLSCFGFLLYFEPQAMAVKMPSIESFTQISSKLSGWLLMPLLFMLIEQDMAQRCFASASPKTVSKATLLAGLATLAICVVPVFLGALARTMNLEIAPGSSVLMTVVAETTNPWMTVFVGCAVFAAIISTATSLISAISSNISSDFMNISYSVKAVKICTCLVAVGAVLFAFYFDNIVDVLIQSYELSVSCLFIPVVIALFKKNGNFLSALLSVSVGAISFFLFRLYLIDFSREIISVLLSLIGYGCGELLSYQLLTRQTQ